MPEELSDVSKHSYNKPVMIVISVYISALGTKISNPAGGPSTC